MLPEIWSATDIIFVHFGLCFALLPHYWHRKLKFEKNVKNTLNEDHMMYQKSWSYMLHCPWYPWDWAIILPFPQPPPSFLPSFLIAQTSFKGLKMVKKWLRIVISFFAFSQKMRYCCLRSYTAESRLEEHLLNISGIFHISHTSFEAHETGKVLFLFLMPECNNIIFIFCHEN